MSDGGSSPATASSAAAAHVASDGCCPARAASPVWARTEVGPTPDSAIRASATIPLRSRRRAAATPAMAKSPLRRLNSWNDHPGPRLPGREAHRGQELVRLERRSEEPLEEVRRGDTAHASGAPRLNVAVE